MLVNLPISNENKEFLYNLEEQSLNKLYNDYSNFIINNGFIETSDIGVVEKTKYLSKDICVEYIENISEPSFTVPTDTNFRYVLKRNNEYLFNKKNPKKIEVYDSLLLKQLVDTKYTLTDTVIATELYTNENDYKVYSLPFGGIDKGDSYFYYVNNNHDIKELSANIDYVSGLIYIEEDQSESISFIFGYFNLVPLRIIPKGEIKVEEQVSGFYTVKNIDINNCIKLEYLNSTTLLLTTYKNIIIELPLESTKYTIDGVTFVPGQTTYLEKNETVYIERKILDEKNIEYLSLNTNVKESIDDSDKKDFIFLDSNSEEKVDNYLLKIINKENKNTYMKQTPIILQLF